MSGVFLKLSGPLFSYVKAQVLAAYVPMLPTKMALASTHALKSLIIWQLYLNLKLYCMYKQLCKCSRNTRSSMPANKSRTERQEV